VAQKHKLIKKTAQWSGVVRQARSSPRGVQCRRDPSFDLCDPGRVYPTCDENSL